MTPHPPVEPHPLRPFLPEGARLLMLGSFPPQPKRWSMPFFYPNPQNDMWRIVGHVFFNDRNYFFDAATRSFRELPLRQFLAEKGIALFDTASAVRRLRDNASDQFLEIVEETDIRALLRALPSCRAVAATGGRAAEVVCAQFGVPLLSVGGSQWVPEEQITLYRMPSSSRSYPLAFEKKAAFYAQLFEKEL